MARTADPLLADRRRRQIMDAAIACFRRRGFHQTSMQEICAEAAISAGALYRYFASKTEIIAAIAEEMHAESDDAFVRAAEEIGFLPALELAAASTFSRMLEGEGALFAEVLAEAIRDEAISLSLRSIATRTVDVFATAVESAQARGEIDRKLDPLATANTLLALIEGISLRQAFLRQLNAGAALTEFCLVAERFLSPSHET